MAGPTVRRPRNDPVQYDELAEQWWDRRGPFAMLHWLAAERARLVPPPRRPGAVLVDVGCGAGLLAPHLSGYRHVGVDRSVAALRRAAGLAPVAAEATALPLADGCADVVVAGEVLEHVPDPFALLDEACRVLAPGGTLVLDTLAATRTARLVAVTLAERLPGGPPRRLHDPRLFVDRTALVRRAAAAGVPLQLHGLRPSLPGYWRWLTGRTEEVPMVRSRYTGVLVAAVGVRRADPGPSR